MSRLGDYVSALLAFWRRSRDENLRWQLTRQEELAQLRQAQAMAEEAVLAQLKLKSQQLAHTLAINETKNRNELAMVKIQCQQELQDYQQYLQSLDKLKDSLRHSYANLPEAVAFTIHHHAKQLLNRMWDAQDEQEKLRAEIHLIQFMTAVHEDSQASLVSDRLQALPQRTLACIDAERQS